jgi:hypothetical protein
MFVTMYNVFVCLFQALGVCNDDTVNWCCATGSCNIFCCNCDGECRGDSESGRSIGVNEHVLFQRIDTNQDAKLSKDETLQFLGKLYASSFQFSDYDLNVDGYLSDHEIEHGERIH